MVPEALCEGDVDCHDGDVCFFFTPLCSCGGQASECRLRCTASSCESDETCNETSGICEPTRCGPTYACPEHTVCVDDGGDAHGCERLACTSDEDCGCGACVEGRCFSELGFSSPPA